MIRKGKINVVIDIEPFANDIWVVRYNGNYLCECGSFNDARLIVDGLGSLIDEVTYKGSEEYQ